MRLFVVMEYSSMFAQHPTFLTYLSVKLVTLFFIMISQNVLTIVWNAYLKTELLPSLRTALLRYLCCLYSLFHPTASYAGFGLFQEYLTTNFGLGTYLLLAPMPPDTLYYSFQRAYVSVIVSILWQQECLLVFVTFASPVPGMVPGSKVST